MRVLRLNQSRAAAPARKHLVRIVLLWQKHEAMARRALRELRWHSGGQHSPPKRRNGHAPPVDNGELDDAPQPFDGLSAWPERLPVATEGLGFHIRQNGSNNGALGWPTVQGGRDLGMVARVGSDAYKYVLSNLPVHAKHQEDI